MAAPERHDLPVAVRTSGASAPFVGSSSPGTKQGDWMIAAIVAGRGEYRWSRGRIALVAGMVALFDPADRGLMLGDDEDPYGYRWCRFGGGYARAWAAALRRDWGAPAREHPRFADVCACMARMGKWVAAELPRRMGRREILLLEALQLLDEEQERAPQPLDPARVRAYLEERLHRPFDLAEMAAGFGMTRSSLCRAVRRVCGSTPQRLHEEIKMAWAETLLREDDLRVADVARRLGYDDALYFSRVFRRRHGCAPREWRARHRLGTRARPAR